MQPLIITIRIWAFKGTTALSIGEGPLQDSSVHAFYLFLVATAMHKNPPWLPRRILRMPLTLPGFGGSRGYGRVCKGLQGLVLRRGPNCVRIIAGSATLTPKDISSDESLQQGRNASRALILTQIRHGILPSFLPSRVRYRSGQRGCK